LKNVRYVLNLEIKDGIAVISNCSANQAHEFARTWQDLQDVATANEIGRQIGVSFGVHVADEGNRSAVTLFNRLTRNDGIDSNAGVRSGAAKSPQEVTLAASDL